MGQVVDKELEDQEGEEPFAMGQPLTIELDSVDFKGFNDKKILKNLSLKIDPGERILIKGLNGAGKSTLLRLVAGLVHPTAGEIYVNDISLKSIRLNHYRALLGQSITEESPFEGTILENITLGDTSVSKQDVHWAMEKTGLLSFVKRQPKGVNTIIYPEGIQMPYSVSKKLILARSIVRKPALLILNDPLDQLDEEEENRILEFLFSEENSWSILVASKDPKWEKYCSRIIQLEKGRIKNNT